MNGGKSFYVFPDGIVSAAKLDEFFAKQWHGDVQLMYRCHKCKMIYETKIEACDCAQIHKDISAASKKDGSVREEFTKFNKDVPGYKIRSCK